MLPCWRGVLLAGPLAAVAIIRASAERRRGWRQRPASMLLVEPLNVMDPWRFWLAGRAVDSLARMCR